MYASRTSMKGTHIDRLLAGWRLVGWQGGLNTMYYMSRRNASHLFLPLTLFHYMPSTSMQDTHSG